MEYKGNFAQGTSGCNYHAAKQKKRQVPFLENFELSVFEDSPAGKCPPCPCSHAEAHEVISV